MKYTVLAAAVLACLSSFGQKIPLVRVASVRSSGGGGSVVESPEHPGYAANADRALTAPTVLQAAKDYADEHKAEKADTLEGYGITNGLTKAEAGSAVNAAIASAMFPAESITNKVGATFVDFSSQVVGEKPSDGMYWRTVPAQPYFSPDGLAFGVNKFVAGAGGDVSGLWYSTPDGLSWTRSNVTRGEFSFIVYANGMFITGDSYEGRGLYSSNDGVTWSKTALASGNFVAGAGGSGRFVVSRYGDDLDGVWYSFDGSTWERSSIHQYVSALAYGSGKFIASVNNGGIWYSFDGAYWYPSAVDYGTYDALFAADGVFLAGSTDQYQSYHQGIHISTNGVDWTLSEKRDGQIAAFGYGNGYYLASEDNWNYVWRSNDGITWTKTGLENAYIRHFAYGNGVFLGTWGSSDYCVSLKLEDRRMPVVQSIKVDGTPAVPDENNCISITTSGTTPDQVRTIVHGIVAPAALDGTNYTDSVAESTLQSAKDYTDTHAFSGKLPFSSVTNATGHSFQEIRDATVQVPNPTSWTRSSSPTGSGASVLFGDNAFVAGVIDSADRGIWKSADGISWTRMATGNTWDLGYGEGIYVCMFEEQGVFWSYDCTTWTSSGFNPDSGCSFAFGKGRFVCGTRGSGIWTSSDGKSWTQSERTGGTIKGLAFGAGKFVASVQNGGFIYSLDGIRWNSTSRSSGTWHQVSYCGGRFFAGAEPGGVWLSEDGIDWHVSKRTSGRWYSVAYGNGCYVATGDSGVVYSHDGENWTTYSGQPSSGASIAFGKGRFVIGGSYLYYSGTNYVTSVPLVQQIRINGKIAVPDADNVVNIETSSSGGGSGGGGGGGSTPLSGITIDFKDNEGYYKAVELLCRAFGANVTNSNFTTGSDLP